MKKPVLHYPCAWQYKIIGSDEQLLQAAALSAIGDKKHSLAFTNSSTGGKYRTLTLEVTVSSEEERLSIYEKLKNDPNVKIVL
jgi:hypothetical protein